MADAAAHAVSQLLAGHGHRARSVRLLASGLDHAAYEVDGNLIVRVASHPDPIARAGQVERETRLLRVVATVSPVAVPVPLLTDPDRGCIAYAKLPGEPLLALPDAVAHAAPVGAALGGFLAALHALPVEPLADIVGADDSPPAAWLGEARLLYDRLVSRIPPERRAAIAAFLHAEPPLASHARVVAHNDLGIEHVLVDPATWHVTGVIDWTDAALTDPARDFGPVYRDLGPDALDAALRAYGAGGPGRRGLRRRARFYARCGVLEDLAYGLDTGKNAYVTKSIAALGFLFPPGEAW